MSLNVTNYVWDLKFGNATRKLVLLRYADHAHEDGTASWCGIPKVADFAECDERTVKRHIKFLVEHGYMREGDQELVAHLPKNKRPIVYDIALNEATRASWEVYNASGGNGRRESAVVAGQKGAAKRAANKAAKGQVSEGDKMSPQEVASNPAVGGDEMSPQNGGDTRGQFGVTDGPVGGDTHVTQTTLETTLGNHPSSPAAPIEAAAPAPQPVAEVASPDGSASKSAKRGTRIPEDFASTLTAEQVMWARSECPDVDGRMETENFVDYWISKPGKDGVMLDWGRTWKRWMRTAQQRLNQRRTDRGTSYRDADVWGKQPGGGEPMTAAEADALFGLSGDDDAAPAADAG